MGSSRRGVRRVRFGAVALAAALVAGTAISCVPDPPVPQGSDLPKDINLMTDEQAEQALELMSDELKVGFADKRFLAGIPREQLPYVQHIVESFETADGRKALVAELREAQKGVTRGLPARKEFLDIAEAGMAVADFFVEPTGDTVQGTEMPPPSGPGTGTGANVDVGSPTAGACHAPNGIGTVAAPPGVVAGQILTPGHDVYTATSPTNATGQLGDLTTAGVEPVAGQGPGIELRNIQGIQQMRVRINLEDPKRFGPAALYPLIDLKPIGGTADQEYRASITDGKIYCYANDTRTTRGYFEGWVTIPRTEPGFQLIAEVVENDWYFRNVRFDLLLSADGPQYWAGADRSTVHAGAAPLVNTQPLPGAIGAFATGLPETFVGSGNPSVLTDSNGDPFDDIEGALTAYLRRMISSKVDGVLSGDLLQIYIATVQAWLKEPLDIDIDARFTTPQDGFSVPDEPATSTGALQVQGTVNATAGTYIQVLGIPCTSITAHVSADVKANVWADSAGNGTGITPRIVYNLSSDVDLDMPTAAWLDPTCVIARGLDAVAIGEYFIEDGIEDGIASTFLTTYTWACRQNPLLFNSNGQPIDPAAIPESCKVHGSLQKLLEGLDLNEYLPTVSVGSATIKPVITDIDNAWCSAPFAPSGCTGDQDLFGSLGVSVTADTSLVASLSQALGGGLGGRFRNVFAPTTRTTPAYLTTFHRDVSQRIAGLGLVVDPRLVNLALRHLVQGSSTSRTTNGLIDVDDVPLGDGTLSAHPEVAPMVLGMPTAATCPNCVGNLQAVGGTGTGSDVAPIDASADATTLPSPPATLTTTMVVPDLRVALTAGTSAPIQFSVAVSVGVGLAFDASTHKMRPILQSPQVDFQVTGGCGANYDSAYALSYTLCGRGTGGNGGSQTNGNPISLSSVVAWLANTVAKELTKKSFGEMKPPALDGIVPGMSVTLDNVRFAQRGGFLTLYADLRPTPRVGIAASTEDIGGVTYLRFFPQRWNIDTTLPTTYTWVIKDKKTGLPVSAPPYPTAPSAVYTPVTNFQEVTGNFGPERTALATLTLTQKDSLGTTTLEVSASTEFTWHPPSPPPTNPCAPRLMAGLQAGGPATGGSDALPSAIGC